MLVLGKVLPSFTGFHMEVMGFAATLKSMLVLVCSLMVLSSMLTN